MSLRIGILTHKYPRAKEDRIDARIHIYDFAHALAKHANVFVLSPDPGGEKEHDARVPVTWFSGGNLVRLFIKGRQAAVEFVQEKKIDVCLAAWTIPSGYFAYHVKKTLHIPYAIWALGSDIHTYAQYPILRQLIATWLTYADLRFANSYRFCDDVTRLSGKDCTFMPVISDFPTRLQKKRPNFKKPFQFLYVGRLEEIKGIDLLIDACILLKERNASFRLDVVGDGTLHDQLEQEVKEKGLDDDIVFLGNQDKDSVYTHMMKAECLVIPSRKESFPQVLLEAARIGLPAIATDVGDCGIILRRYKCGTVVSRVGSLDLANAMIECLSTRELPRQQFRHGLERFVKTYTAVKPELLFFNAINSIEHSRD